MPRDKDTWEPVWLQRIHVPSWVVLILAFTFVLRIPSFFEPYHYGDEMIYLNMGEAMKKGMVLYRDIYDNKPPLMYSIAQIAGNVFWIRAILAGWMMATTILFWRLSEALFPKNDKIVKAAVFIFAVLTTIPILEGNIANAELFMIGPTIWAFFILLAKKLTARNLFFSGLLMSISTLFKTPAIFDIGAIAFLWLAITKLRKDGFSQLAKQSLFLFLGFASPILFTFVWYWSRGALNEYAVAAFLQNVGYFSAWSPVDILYRGITITAGLVVLYAFRKKLSSQFVFIVAWLLFSLFAATLTGQPYPHYLIQVVPAISLLGGVLLAAQSIEQSLAIVPLFLVFLAVNYFQFWHYKTFDYYKRFVSFAAGETTKEEYFNSFDPNTTRNYKIAEYLLTSSAADDKVFVWGDSPAIYALSNRLPPIKYTTTYHIIDLSSQEETVKALKEDKPKFIIVMEGSPDFPLLRNFLLTDYLLIEEIDGARIWKTVGFSIESLIKYAP